jgi:fatty-acyl-CoA synthase
VNDLHTIGRWIRDRARTTPERVAIEHLGRTLTYAELDDASERVAASLLERGLARGDRVATLTGNSPDHVAVFYACAKAGLLLVPLSWRLAPAELAYQLDDSEPAVFLVEDEYRELAAATGHDYEPLSIPDAVPGLSRDMVAEDGDPLLLVYTSGTTGRPKGALLTHANCFWTNLSFDLATGVGADDVVLQILPQFHCGGWNVHALLAWWKGATVVLERSFDPARCLQLIEQKRVTALMGVPANYLFMSQEPAFATTDFSSLRSAVVGGAPMPEALVDVWRGRGVEVVEGYGLTEAAPNVLYAGKPYPNVELRVSPESELQVRGPNVFAGYWRNPEATAAAFDGAWLRTGDVAECDDAGLYRIKDRLKDMYISGGENVYPAEVEGVLHEHPAVADVAVVGVPDERWGEVGVAFVVAAGDVSEGQLRDFARERLARFKAPKEVRFVDALPRSGMGKVLKEELGA